jgi:protein-disulfide isomerase
MLKTIILTTALSVAASSVFAQSSNTTAGSDAVAGATNSLTLEGSVSGSVGVGNNTAPCQQVNGFSALGTGWSNSRTLEWCLSEQMAKTLAAVSEMTGEKRRAVITTLCTTSKDYRKVLVSLNWCVVRKK